MSNITLIGMAGVGKSTIGKQLAKLLDMHYIDTDDLIIEREGRQLFEIIDALGEEKFKMIEAEIVMSLNPSKTIISPGGSIVLMDKVMQYLKSISKVVYLHADWDIVDNRLYNPSTRGIIMSGYKTMEEVYKYRLHLYKKYADMVIDAGSDPSSAVKKIIQGIDNA